MAAWCCQCWLCSELLVHRHATLPIGGPVKAVPAAQKDDRDKKRPTERCSSPTGKVPSRPQPARHPTTLEHLGAPSAIACPAVTVYAATATDTRQMMRQLLTTDLLNEHETSGCGCKRLESERLDARAHGSCRIFCVDASHKSPEGGPQGQKIVMLSPLCSNKHDQTIGSQRTLVTHQMAHLGPGAFLSFPFLSFPAASREAVQLHGGI